MYRKQVENTTKQCVFRRSFMEIPTDPLGIQHTELLQELRGVKR